MFELALYSMFQFKQSPWPNERPFVLQDAYRQESIRHCSTAAFLYRLEPLIVEVPENSAWNRTSATYTTGSAAHPFTCQFRRLDIAVQNTNGAAKSVPLVFFEHDNYFYRPSDVPGVVSTDSKIWFNLPLPASRYFVLGRRPSQGNVYFNYQPGSLVEIEKGFLVEKPKNTPGPLQLWRTPSSNANELAVFAFFPTTRKSAPKEKGLLSSLIRLVDEAKSDDEMHYYSRLFLRGWFAPEDNPLDENRPYDDQVRDAGALASSLCLATSNLKKKALLSSCAVRLGRQELWRTAVETHFSLRIKDSTWKADSFPGGWIYEGPRDNKPNNNGRGRFIIEQCSRLPINDNDSSSLARFMGHDWQEDMREPAREYVSRVGYSASRPPGQRYDWSILLYGLASCLKIYKPDLTRDQMVEALKEKLDL